MMFARGRDVCVLGVINNNRINIGERHRDGISRRRQLAAARAQPSRRRAPISIIVIKSYLSYEQTWRVRHHLIMCMCTP